MKNTKQQQKSTSKPAGRERVEGASSLSTQVEALRSDVTKMNGTLAGLVGSVDALRERLPSTPDLSGCANEERYGRVVNDWRPGEKCWVSLFLGFGPTGPHECVVYGVYADHLIVNWHGQTRCADLEQCYRNAEAASAFVRALRASVEEHREMSKLAPPPSLGMPPAPRPALQVVRDGS